MRPEVYLLIGLPASGKTTLAKEWVAEDPDARIWLNYDKARLARGMTVWNRKEEEEMKKAVREACISALRAGLSVVIDNTNLSKGARAAWAQIAIAEGAEYVEQEVDTPIAECIQRDRTRDARVGQAVIDNMAIRYGLLDWDVCDCRYTSFPGEHRGCGSKQPICIVDLDGTIANDDHRLGHIQPSDDGLQHKMDCALMGKTRAWDGTDLLHPCRSCGVKIRKDWQAYFAAVGDDLPITRVINLLERLHDHLVVIVSGRPIQDGATKVGILTEDWLLKHNIHFDRLFLKAENHKRAVEHKREMLDYLPKGRVAYVFDDHRECIEMYRRELPNACVLQVGEQS